VYLVTTLADYDKHKGQPPIPGSLRATVEAEGPRIVIFRVGGNIELKRGLQISRSFITIAGQTAPGDGICLKGQTTIITGAHDVVIRHLRFRPGDVSKEPVDAFAIYGGRDIILDHCSTSWSLDELLSTQRSKDITVQWCIMALPLDRSFHQKGAHAAGSLINGVGGITYHHNIYAHCRVRSPRVQDDVLLDFRNNVIYNWDERAGYNVKDPVRINYDGKYAYGDGKCGVLRNEFTPVKTFPPNPWGLYDMHGNVYEWGYDTLSKYPTGPVIDPAVPGVAEPNMTLKVLRGGSFSTRPQFLRSASRFRYIPRAPYGFRVVMEVE
jgi:hypothetical protein